MVRRLRRVELMGFCALLFLLVVNLIYFEKIDLQLGAPKYLSRISTGTSPGSNDDYDYDDGENERDNAFLWPSSRKTFDKSKIQEAGGDFLQPKDLQQSANEKAFMNWKKQMGINDDYDSESESESESESSPSPEEDYNLNEAQQLEDAYEDYATEDDDTTSYKPPPLKPPKVINIPSPMPDNTNSSLDLCPENASSQLGRIKLSVEGKVTLEEVQDDIAKDLYVGGFYVPPKCKARHRVAIIVPYRNREIELAIFLKNIHPFLMKQQIEYGIFVIEQTVGTKFNRGMLLNVGFLEAKKVKPYDCYIFHDVDLLPMDDRNIYTCSRENPRHLAMAVDKLNNEFPALNTLSGVIAVTSEQFEKINGYSNHFWGWGAEDLDFLNRLKAAGYGVDPFEAEIGRYATFNRHDPEKPNAKRFELLEKGETQLRTSGLNTTKYIVRCVDKSPLYTWIFTTLKEEVPGEASNVEMLGVN